MLSTVALYNVCSILSSAAGTDYVFWSVSKITFNSGKTELFYDISIIDDNVYELPETFTVSMSTTDSSMRFGVGSAIVTIIDTDGRLLVVIMVACCYVDERVYIICLTSYFNTHTSMQSHVYMND